jgi:hypothetical protein
LIEGPSIRLAEIALACWGNISAASRVVADDGKFVTSQGVAWDMEKNIRISKETKRRVTNREGRRFSDDMVAVTGNAACSISLRNAIVSVIPGIIIKDVYEAAKKVAAGSAATLGSRRVAAMAKFKEMGVDESRVFSALGVKGLEDINLEKITILIGLYNAIQDKETTIEEAFPTLTVKSPTVAGVTGKPAVTSTFTAGSGNPPTVQETKKASEDLIWLQQQMVENNIDEKIVIEHMRAAQFSDESLDSLAMIDEMQPEALQRTRKFWKSFVKKLKPSEPAK